MIVLDRGIFDGPTSDIGQTQVLSTVFEGRVVYWTQPTGSSVKPV